MKYRTFVGIIHCGCYEQFFNISKGDIVVDIGAHVGTFTVEAAKKVGAQGLVVAIEPEPRNLRLLKHNVEHNMLTNVRIVPKAISNYSGKGKLFLISNDEGHSLNRVSNIHIEVEVDCLDNIVSYLGLNHVDFVKIDAEGAEYEILRGAQKTLSYPKIKLAIAAYHKLPTKISESSIIESYLRSIGFRTRAKSRGEYIIYATRG